ncbi:hypothetical protein M3_0025 [Lysinibacillus phage vB_LfM_LysYB1]|nr:hypothetical protein M3_0025 [Lysinibacillus phage vB_LfM_LysYB1]WAB25232.1 hypothetical protein M5_0054 [Lysinibacillus phage vB_LfM_LysYB2]
MEQLFLKIQKKLFDKHGFRTDAHYKEGYGVIFVPEGFPLLPSNAVQVYSEHEIQFLQNILLKTS